MSEWKIVSTNASLQETVSVPFDGDALRKMIDEGFVTRETLLESVETKERKRAGQVRGLFEKQPQIRTGRTGIDRRVDHPSSTSSATDVGETEFRSEYLIARGLQAGSVAGASVAAPPPDSPNTSATGAVAAPQAPAARAKPLRDGSGSDHETVEPASPTATRRSRGSGTLALLLACLSALPIGYFAADRYRVSEVNGEVEQLEHQRDELQQQSDALRDQIRLEEESIKELDQTKEELDREIDRLTAQRDTILHWRTADVVLTIPGECVVGLDLPDSVQSSKPFQASGGDRDAPTVLYLVEGEQAVLATKAVVNARVPVLAGDNDLVKDVARLSKPNERLSASLSAEFMEHYGEQNLLADLEAGDERRWLTFVDNRSGRRRTGYCVGHDNESVRLFSVANRTETFSRDQIVPSTAFLGDFESMLDVVDERDFLDLSLLRCMEHLTVPGRRQLNHAVAVHVELGSIDRTWSDQVQDPLRPRLLEEGGSIEGEGLLGSLLAGGLIAADYLGALADYESRKQLADEERSRRKDLEDSAAYLEGEILNRLTRSGVATVSKENLALRASALGLSQSDFASPTEAGRKLLITHLLVASVKPPAATGRFNLELSLHDCREGEMVVSESADRVRESISEVRNRLKHGYRNWFADAGELALVPTGSLSDRGIESPERAPGIRQLKGVPAEVTPVYVEREPGSVASGDNWTYYRPLFSVERRSLPDNIEPQLIRSINDVPVQERLRYVLCQILRECTPCAGRVVRVDGNQAFVDLGVQHSVKPGDLLRVLRVSDAGSYIPGGQHGDLRLATTLRVNAVSAANDKSCVATINPSGLAEIWPDWDEALRVGDLATPWSIPRPVIGIAPPCWGGVDLTRSEWHGLNARAKGRAARRTAVYEGARTCSLLFMHQMTAALKDLNTEVRGLTSSFGDESHQEKQAASTHRFQVDELRKQGVTHAVGGWIVAIDDEGQEFRLILNVLPLQGAEGEQELLRSFTFDIPRKVIPLDSI